MVVAATVALTFTGTIFAGRWLGVPLGSAVMVATGFAICGVSAAAAMNAVTDSDEQDLATAAALVTLYGSLAIVALPAAAAALALAVVVKLSRVVLLAPLVAGVGVVGASRRTAGPRPPVVTLFVLAFLVMVAVRSTGVVHPPMLTCAGLAAELLLAGALFGSGTGVHLRDLIQTGRRAVLLGAIATAIATAVSYAGAMWAT